MGAVTGFFGNLFGTAKAGEALVNNISSGLGKLVYTDQEKADDAAKARSEGFKVYSKWLESTSGSRLARRFIALVVVGMWAVERGIAAALSAISPFIDDVGAITAQKCLAAANVLDGYAMSDKELVATVLLFYFGGPVAMEGIKGMMNRWVNKPGSVKPNDDQQK